MCPHVEEKKFVTCDVGDDDIIISYVDNNLGETMFFLNLNNMLHAQCSNNKNVTCFFIVCVNSGIE